MAWTLCELGHDVGQRRVRRLLRIMGLMAVYPKPRIFMAGNYWHARMANQNTSERTLTRFLHRSADSILHNTGAHLLHTAFTSSTRDAGMTYAYNTSGLVSTVTTHLPGADHAFAHTYTPTPTLPRN